MHWLFAYGSNMHLGDLFRWFSSSNLPPGRIVQAEPAELVGYRLVWNYYSQARGGAAANIEAAAAMLPGVLLRVDRRALAAIDCKEGYPTRYGRSLCPAVTRGGHRVLAWAYMVEPSYRLGSCAAPTRGYRDLLVEGATLFDLPIDHIRALGALSTAD